MLLLIAILIAILIVMAVLALAGPALEDLLHWIGAVGRRWRHQPAGPRAREHSMSHVHGGGRPMP